MRLFLLLVLWTASLFSGDWQKAITYSETGPNRVGHILIDDKTSGISQSTWIYVKNALDYYKKNRPIFIILELNTPGGEIYAAQKISDALKEIDTQYDIPVVTFINNWAISAGAMLAYSTRVITTVKDGSMGAAEPVLPGEGGKLEPVSEKMNSAVRADFANRAAFFDRNPFIAEAMVDKDLILVRREGKIIKLDNESQIDPKTDKLISPKGKLLTLTSQEMSELGVADLVLPPAKLVPLTEEELSSGRWPASKTLLFTAPFFNQIPQAEVVSYRMDWKEQFLSWLAHPAVQSLLFLGLMVGFYMELSTPGFGVPGALGVLCLILIVLSSYSQEIASLLEVVLLLTGLAILLVDLFVLPTFGLMGFIGLVFFVAGLLGLMLPGLTEVSFELDTQSFNSAGEALITRLAWLGAAFLTGLGAIALMARTVSPNLKVLQKFILKGEQTGFKASDNPSLLPQSGASGLVVSTLRPSGKIEVAGTIYEAVSTGQFIEKGERVEVVRLEGNSLVVHKEGSEEG